MQQVRINRTRKPNKIPRLTCTDPANPCDDYYFYHVPLSDYDTFSTNDLHEYHNAYDGYDAYVPAALATLTAKQLQIVERWLEGKTQQDIAKELNLHQTTIHKVLHGNLLPNGQRYGGALKKLEQSILDQASPARLGTKKCTNCREVKLTEKFYRSKGNRVAWCKECHRKERQKRKARQETT